MIQINNCNASLAIKLSALITTSHNIHLKYGKFQSLAKSKHQLQNYILSIINSNNKIEISSTIVNIIIMYKSWLHSISNQFA